MKPSYFNLFQSVLVSGLIYFAIALIFGDRPFLTVTIKSVIFGMVIGSILYFQRKNRIKK